MILLLFLTFEFAQKLNALFDRPGEICKNGGQFMGWTCAQAPGCQFSTPTGVLTAACVDGWCCTSRLASSSSQRCPSNLRRTRRSCSRDSECTIKRRGEDLAGKCRQSSCCVQRRSRKRRATCRQDERRASTHCSSSRVCPFTATCRSGRCCVRTTAESKGGCPANTRPIGACGLGGSQCTLWMENSWVTGQCYGQEVCCARAG